MRSGRLPQPAIAAIIMAAFVAIGLFGSALVGTGLVGVIDRVAANNGRSDATAVDVLGAIELPAADAETFLGAVAVPTVPPTTVLVEPAPTSVLVEPVPTTVLVEPAPPTTVAVEPTPVEISTTPAITAAPAPTRDDIGWDGVARVDYPWRTAFPQWTVTLEAGRDGVRALTFPSSKRIEIYVRPSDTPATIARVFAHELGHVVDIELNSEADRARWREVRGIYDAPWWPDSSTYDFDTLAGDFAEAFATWKVGSVSQSHVGGALGSAEFALLAELSAG